MKRIHRMTRYRLETIKMLGGKCVQCGCNDFRALEIDHVKDNGAQERKKLKPTGSDTRYYRRIFLKVKSGSKDYQVLCANCNRIKEWNRTKTEAQKRLVASFWKAISNDEIRKSPLFLKSFPLLPDSRHKMVYCKISSWFQEATLRQRSARSLSCVCVSRHISDIFRQANALCPS